MAGFPHVIGTLWKVQDNDSAEIAQKVYENMLEMDGINIERAAGALHRAVRDLRDKTRRAPRLSKQEEMPHGLFIWTPYIHSGS